MSRYKFEDKPDQVWLWKLEVETTGAVSQDVRLTNGKFAPCLSPGISSKGIMYLVDHNLIEAERLLGARLLNAERLGPAFFPKDHQIPLTEGTNSAPPGAEVHVTS